MKHTTIAEVKEKADGEGIVSITGTLKSIYATKRGVKDGKPWSFQDLVLSDPTGDIKVVVQGKDAGQEVPQSLLGKTVTLSAYKGAKGWSGLYVHDHEYPEGTFTRKIKVTRTGDIRESEGDESPHAGTATIREPDKGREVVPVEDLVGAATKYLNASFLIERLAYEQALESEKFGVALTEANFGGKVAGALRYASHLIALQPTTPIWKV